MNEFYLDNVRESCRLQLLFALEKFVRDNGREMSDYYRNEHGIDEDYYGYDVVKILDTAEFGCCFPLPLMVNDDALSNGDENPTLKGVDDSFNYYAYWSFYIAKDRDTGIERLMYYKFWNSGLMWSDEGSEPDHDYADDLSLAQLDYIYTAIIYGFKEDKK